MELAVARAACIFSGIIAMTASKEAHEDGAVGVSMLCIIISMGLCALSQLI